MLWIFQRDSEMFYLSAPRIEIHFDKLKDSNEMYTLYGNFSE